MQINKTESICDVCLKRVSAEIVEKEGHIHIKKECKEHGKFESLHIWDDPDTFRRLMSFNKFNYPSRKILLNITNDCNMDCAFCYAKANQLKIDELDFERLKKLDLNRFEYIFLSGGEPTIKDDLFSMIKYLKKNRKKVFLLTNGLRIMDDSFARRLKKTGVDLVILQFDNLCEEDVKALRGTPVVKDKFKIVENLAKHDIPVYFFSIQLEKNNENNMKDLIRYFQQHKNTIKGINFNTIWKIGRYDSTGWIPTSRIMENFCNVTGLDKKEFLDSTEFIYYLFILIARYKDRRRYFSRCLLFLLVIFDKDKIIPLSRIFNLKKLTHFMKEITIRNRGYKIINLLFYLLFSQVIINFLVNRNFRALLRDFSKRLKYIFSGNIFLLNPFTTFNVGAFPTAEDFDFNFVDTCNLLNYSPKDGKVTPVCLNQIRFARKNHPLS